MLTYTRSHSRGCSPCTTRFRRWCRTSYAYLLSRFLLERYRNYEALSHLSKHSIDIVFQVLSELAGRFEAQVVQIPEDLS